MARRSNDSRLWAVFLCFAFSVALVLGIALWGLLLEQRAVVRATAQSMMSVQPMLCDGDVLTDQPELFFEQGGAVVDFDERETAAYVAATSRGTRYVRDVLARVISYPTGTIVAVLHNGENVCWRATINPDLHQRAIETIRGEPV
jgi:hypothetical protein